MKEYEVKVTLVEPMLGTIPMDKDIATTFVLSKGEHVDEELETIPPEELMARATTGFHMVGGVPILLDYHLKGFFKDACGMLRRDPESLSAKLTAYKRVIDGMVFVFPRQIPIELSGPTGICERPLRAMTAQGERVCLARSVEVPAGSTLSFKVGVIAVVTKPLIEEWLGYGALRGLGAWRNSGMGRMTYTIS